MSTTLRIRLGFKTREPATLERLAAAPASLTLPLRAVGPGPVPAACVTGGQTVVAGERMATGRHAVMHAPIGGTVALSTDAVRISGPAGARWEAPPDAALAAGASADFGAFLVSAGIVGMGGGMFPAALKFAASRNVHTLVVNGVECEPGVTIDEAILLHDAALVRAGAEAIARAVGTRETVLAIKDNRALVARLRALYGWRIVRLPGRYPSGAERLILERLTGERLPAAILPMHVGYIVHNVATVRAVGRAARDGVPCVERPLCVMDLVGKRRRNLIVPVGISAADVLAACGWALEPGQILVAGGLMMGQRIEPSEPVTKGTTALALVSAGHGNGRRPCIRCGACYDACPAGLHPIDLAERLTAAARPFARLVRGHMDECILCGACSAVCPSHIPIAAMLREARRG